MGNGEIIKCPHNLPPHICFFVFFLIVHCELIMTECPKNGSKLNISLPEPRPVEYWWDPDSSSPCLYSFISYSWQRLTAYFFSVPILSSSSSTTTNVLRISMIVYDCSSSSMIRNNPRHRKWKLLPALNLASIEEERGLSEYDCGYIDLGAETPVSASTSNLLESPGFIENWSSGTLRRPSSSPITNGRYKKYAVDRDCGIW